MFVVSEAEATAIRADFDQGGEFAAAVGLGAIMLTGMAVESECEPGIFEDQYREVIEMREQANEIAELLGLNDPTGGLSKGFEGGRNHPRRSRSAARCARDRLPLRLLRS
jgi:hypothetical protein